MRFGRWESGEVGAPPASAVSPDDSTVVESVKAVAQGPCCICSISGTKHHVAGVITAEVVGVQPAVAVAASLTVDSSTFSTHVL